MTVNGDEPAPYFTNDRGFYKKVLFFTSLESQNKATGISFFLCTALPLHKSTLAYFYAIFRPSMGLFHSGFLKRSLNSNYRIKQLAEILISL